VEHRQPRVRRDLASALRSTAAGLVVPEQRGRRGAPTGDGAEVDPELASLREQLRRHPAHRTPDGDRAVRTAERYLRIERDNAKTRKKVAAATNSLARTFDRIVGLLTERGFIRVGEGDSERDPQVTDDGLLLARIYSESDLLVAECLRTGAWEGLDAAEMAAVVSTVLYESRGDPASWGTGGPPGDEPSTAPMRRALHQTRRLSVTLRADEQRHRITPSREPDDGFVAAAYCWARTGDLAAALSASDWTGGGSPLPAGDFVRWCRQLLDMLDQLRHAGPDPDVRVTAKRAIDTILRGVVAVDAR
jgi:ATP-dependent RNA helicase HelY